MDSKEPDWSKFQDFIMGEVRYNSLLKTFYKFGLHRMQSKQVCFAFGLLEFSRREAKELFAKTEQFAKLRYEGYKKLSEGK